MADCDKTSSNSQLHSEAVIRVIAAQWKTWRSPLLLATYEPSTISRLGMNGVSKYVTRQESDSRAADVRTSHSRSVMSRC